MQLDYFVNIFPLQFVKVSGSRGALVGLQLEVVGDEGDGGGGGKRDNVRGEEAVFVVAVFVSVAVGIVVVIVVVVIVFREGIKKNRFFLGKSPKLWVGGGQES